MDAQREFGSTTERVIMLNKLIIGREKAVIGGLSAGILSLVGQLGVNGQMTLKEGIYAVATWLVTHLVIYTSTNTYTPPPTVIAPIAPLVNSDTINT